MNSSQIRQLVNRAYKVQMSKAMLIIQTWRPEHLVLLVLSYQDANGKYYFPGNAVQRLNLITGDTVHHITLRETFNTLICDSCQSLTSEVYKADLTLSLMC